MTTTQLNMFGGKTETEKFVPYAAGDVVVTKPFGRMVVRWVSDNIHGAVLGGVRVDTGVDCVAFEREVLYRSR